MKEAIASGLNKRFKSLENYNFRLYFTGSLISVAGTWMQTTGQAWLVLKITGSPVALATVAALQFLPMLLFKALKQIRAFGQAQPMRSRPLQFPSAELIGHCFG